MGFNTSASQLTILEPTGLSNANIAPFASPLSKLVKVTPQNGQSSRHSYSGPTVQPPASPLGIPHSTWLMALNPSFLSTSHLPPFLFPTFANPFPLPISSPLAPASSRSVKTIWTTSATASSKAASLQSNSSRSSTKTRSSLTNSDRVTLSSFAVPVQTRSLPTRSDQGILVQWWWSEGLGMAHIALQSWMEPCRNYATLPLDLFLTFLAHEPLFQSRAFYIETTSPTS